MLLVYGVLAAVHFTLRPTLPGHAGLRPAVRPSNFLLKYDLVAGRPHGRATVAGCAATRRTHPRCRAPRTQAWLHSERDGRPMARRPVHPPGLVPRASVGPPDHQ